MKKETLAALEKKAPEEIKEIRKWIADVEAKNLAVLGEDECFKIADKRGEIRAFKTNVRLSAADGTLVPAFSNGPMTISASGYVKIQEAAGAVVMNAPTLVFEGEVVKNPCVILHPETKRTLKVVCRSIAFRYTNKGIPQVSDRVAVLDLPAYRMTVLMAKAKKYPQCFKLLPIDITPPKDEEKVWAKYQFDEATCLWVETTHKEVLDFYRQIVNMEKKAVETCQTFAHRNAIKHLVGLAKVPDSKNIWNLPVVCWRPLQGSVVKWDAAQYVKAQVTLGAIAEARTLDEGSIETTAIETGTDDIDPEDPDTREAVEEDEQTGNGENTESLGAAMTNGKVPVATEKKTENKENLTVAQTQIAAAKEAMPEYYDQAIKNLDIDDELLTDKEAKLINKEMNRLVDLANAAE